MGYAAALQERRIRGAGLDVTYAEPLPQGSPLWELDNVLLSPHSAVRGETIFTAPKQQFNELAKLCSCKDRSCSILWMSRLATRVTMYHHRVYAVHQGGLCTWKEFMLIYNGCLAKASTLLTY